MHKPICSRYPSPFQGEVGWGFRGFALVHDIDKPICSYVHSEDSEFSSLSERFVARMAESARTSFSVGQVHSFNNSRAGYRRDDKLRNAIAARDPKRLGSQVDDYHLHLAAIVRIDGARGVRYADAMLRRQAAAGPHLHFEAGGYGKHQSRRHKRNGAGRDQDGLHDSGTDIHAGRPRSSVGGEGESLGVS